MSPDLHDLPQLIVHRCAHSYVHTCTQFIGHRYTPTAYSPMKKGKQELSGKASLCYFYVGSNLLLRLCRPRPHPRIRSTYWCSEKYPHVAQNALPFNTVVQRMQFLNHRWKWESFTQTEGTACKDSILERLSLQLTQRESSKG